MTTETLTEREQRFRAETAVLEFLRDRLREVCSLNRADLWCPDENWDAPTHFLAEIHVPVGTIDEAYDAVIDVLNEALGGAGHIFSGPNVSPDVVIERDGSELYTCHSVRFGMRVRDMRDEDLF